MNFKQNKHSVCWPRVDYEILVDFEEGAGGVWTNLELATKALLGRDGDVRKRKVMMRGFGETAAVVVKLVITFFGIFIKRNFSSSTVT